MSAVRGPSGVPHPEAEEAREPFDVVDNLRDRLENAAGTLQAMAQAKYELKHMSDYDRLRGKVEGVRLALSFLREYERISEPSGVLFEGREPSE